MSERTKFNAMDWMSETHPNLIHIEFYKIGQLTNAILIEFEALKPQLQKLFMQECNGLTSSSLQQIATRLPNLVELEIYLPLKKT